MASSPYSDSVEKGLTDLRMKIIKQKIANEREKLNRPNSVESTEDVDEQLRLQQAMLKRQELLDRIRHEQIVNQQSDQRRPRSYTERHRYTPSPALNPPPSRLSLPDLNRNKGDITYRDPYQKMYGNNREMSGVKHVVEHQYKPNYPYHLPQMESYPMPVPAAVPQQVIQRIPVPVVPQPVYQNLVPPAEQPKGSMFNKNDFMEMMMVQHQQMHQMMLQQMMLRQMGGGPPHHHCAPSVVAEPVVVPRASGQVHHHHYGMSPAPSVPQQPVVHHYSQLPAIDGGRMLSPARGVRSTPGYYFTNGDSGSNYYVYH